MPSDSEPVVSLVVGEDDDCSWCDWEELPSLVALKKAYVKLVVQRFRGNQSRTAKALNVNRTTIYKILRAEE